MMTLTNQDRCDRCSAPALAVTKHGDRHLYWCRHHYVEHEEKLAEMLVYYRDDSHKETQPA